MNKKEFIEWLSQFPDDTAIRVSVQNSEDGTSCLFEDFIGQGDYRYRILENNTKKGKRVLELGVFY